MTEELSSTNINDILNENDTEMNDDVVDKILNELENSDIDSNTNIKNDNNFNINDLNNNFNINDIKNNLNNNDFNNNDFNENFNDFNSDDFNTNNFNNNFKKEDNRNENESESTINKINTILNLDTDYNFSIINIIFNDFKKTIIVIIIMLLLNNSFIVNLLSNLISKLITNNFINTNISLIIRALLSGVLFFITEKVI